MRIGYLSLGCKVNAYETEGMKQKLEAAGYITVPFETEADVYIVNTCTVTNMADKKSRQMLHRARKSNSNAVIIAVGCYVQEMGEKLLRDKVADIIIGNSKKDDIVDQLEKYLESHDGTAVWSSNADISKTRDYEELDAGGMRENTRAYVKIQDGCNQFCSYCIIPYVRGRIRSRTEENILHEIDSLANYGYKEVVLTGIHLSSYGLDTDTSLINLIQKIADNKQIERIRLGSLEPRIITGEFAGKLSKINKVCPHFHLSLQSGCDETLKRMNRKYSSSEYFEAVKILRACYDEPALTTDIIVGFPGETEEEFEKSMIFARKTGFYMIHVFKYSVREGTKAAVMSDQIDEHEKTARSNRMQKLADEMRHEYMNHFIGKKELVLFEESFELDGTVYFTGHNERYMKIAVKCNPDNDYSNSVKTVVISGFLKKDVMLAEISD